MTLPALAELSDLEARLGVDLSGSDSTRAQAALDDASAVIRDEAGVDFLDPEDDASLDPDMPAVIVTICLAVAMRAYDNPNGERSESLGSASVSHGVYGQAGVYLTPTERRMVRKAAGSASVGTVELRQAWVPVNDNTATGFVTATDGGDDMPWTRIDDYAW